MTTKTHQDYIAARDAFERLIKANQTERTTSKQEPLVASAAEYLRPHFDTIRSLLSAAIGQEGDDIGDPRYLICCALQQLVDGNTLPAANYMEMALGVLNRDAVEKRKAPQPDNVSTRFMQVVDRVLRQSPLDAERRIQICEAIRNGIDAPTTNGGE